MIILQSVIGFVLLILLAFCFSENKKQINWRLVITAFILQNFLFLLMRYVPFVNNIIGGISTGLIALLGYAQDGANFIFGDFTNSNKYGFVFLLVVAPTLIFVSSLISILYFFGIIQRVISILAHLLRKVIKLSGAESLVIIADIFLGQCEGPLLIGPYIKHMTRSELACAFIAGIANLSGSVLGMYITLLGGHDQIEMLKFANYLITATFMNAASAIIFAKILFPETQISNIDKEKVTLESHVSNSLLDSIVDGALTGLKITVSMSAILIAIIALVHLINGILGGIGNLLHINVMIANSTHEVFKSLSLEYMFGQVFQFFAFFMGIPWVESLNVGSLLGQKVAINEFVAYISLGQMKVNHLLSENSIFISTFALASFSNFSSIGISIGVFGVLAPTKQKELSSIALRGLFGAVMAGFMTATVAGFWYNILG